MSKELSQEMVLLSYLLGLAKEVAPSSKEITLDNIDYGNVLSVITYYEVSIVLYVQRLDKFVIIDTINGKPIDINIDDEEDIKKNLKYYLLVIESSPEVQKLISLNNDLADAEKQYRAKIKRINTLEKTFVIMTTILILSALVVSIFVKH